jgi:hypothetical protein
MKLPKTLMLAAGSGAIALGAAAWTPSASAADLGGGCCADLEERIAELEATTARKGNRKVSLSISGWVGEQVTYWDDGVQSDAYVTGLGTALASRVRFTGQAEFMPGWKAGYVIHLEVISSDNLTTSQDTPDGVGVMTGTPSAVQAYESYWFVQNDRLGKVSVGKQSPPSDNGAILVDGSGTIVPANWVISGAYSFKIRNDAGGFVTNGGVPLTWGATGACFPGDCLGLPFNIVRYDSPTWGGFSFSGSWGEANLWDVGVRYSGEHAGFKVAAAFFYGENGGNPPIGAPWPNAEWYQVGGYVQHIETGLWGFVNYGAIHDETRAAAGLDPDVLHVKGGIRKKLTPLGATVPYGEYMVSEEGLSKDSKFELWGLGLVQEIDAAAMSLFLKYRQYSFSDADLCAAGCQDFNELTFGALISF